MGDNELPTVKVVNPNTPHGYMIINERDLTDEHELLDAEPAAPTIPPAISYAFTVSRGPRGKWFVKRDNKFASAPFETEEQAQNALNDLMQEEDSTDAA